MANPKKKILTFFFLSLRIVKLILFFIFPMKYSYTGNAVTPGKKV